MIPGCFDLQVNGYGGVDFNAAALSPEDIRRACDLLRRDGVRSILATIITDEITVMVERIRRLARARAGDQGVAQVVAGLHVEGPFLSPVDGYRGAHPLAGIRPASVDPAARLIEAGDGLIRMVTLAPECDPGMRTTRFLAEAGVCVAAGHTNASLETLGAACDAGLSFFTHLGNGCPTELPRHDNIVQRALSLRDRLGYSFIADGEHVPFFALRNYLALVGTHRAVIVSDAMSAAGQGPGRFRLGRIEVEVGEDHVVRMPGTRLLAGAAVTLPQATEKLRRAIGCTPDEVHRLTWANPRAVIGGPDDPVRSG